MRRSILLPLVAIVVLSGCGSTSTPSGAASPDKSAAPTATDFTEAMTWTEGQPTPDGCSVMTPEEVSAASGLTIVETMPNLTDQPGCGYYDKDGLVFSTRFHGRGSGDRIWADGVDRLAGVELGGIGDEALWIERAWQVWSWRGDTLVMMGIGRIGETPERLALGKVLAPLMMARFGS